MPRTRPTGVLALTLIALAGCSSNNDNTNPPGGASLSFTPCTRQDDWPVILLALQDGTGPWTLQTPSGGTYSATVQSSKVGVLVASAPTTGSGSEVDVIYATPAELQNYLTGQQCASPLLTGSVTVNNLAAGEETLVGLGWNSTAAFGPGNQTFTTQAPAATADLLGVLSNLTTAVIKMILRHGVTVSAVAPLDFTTSEAFEAITPPLTISGTGSNPVTFREWYRSGGIFRNEITINPVFTTPPTTYLAVPATKEAAGDLHEFVAFTTEPPIGNVQPARTVSAWWHDPVARTLSFDALPATPTISSASSSPYPRLRAQWQMPSGHKYFQLFYYNTSASDEEATLTVTAAYLGTAAVDIAFPDASALAGWRNSWMPVAGVSTTVGFSDFTWTGNQPVLSFAPVDGLVTQTNSWRLSITP